MCACLVVGVEGEERGGVGRGGVGEAGVQITTCRNNGVGT